MKNTRNDVRISALDQSFDPTKYIQIISSCCTRLTFRTNKENIPMLITAVLRLYCIIVKNNLINLWMVFGLYFRIEARHMLWCYE